MKDSTMTHVWTEAGLGQFPFRVKALGEIPPKSLNEANPTAYQNALENLPRGFGCGTCAFCGRAIRINFCIESADGFRFAVGSSCVNKSGDHGMITKVKHLKLKRDRERREAKFMAKMQAKMQAERDRNGGLTDYELAEQKKEAQKKRFEEEVLPLLDPFIDDLYDNRGGFRDGIAKGLEKGRFPEGRGESIMLEILAKQEGRKGSQKYKAEYARLEEEFQQAKQKYSEIYD